MVRGVTKIADEKKPHDHKFIIRFDKEGEFLGGEALAGDGVANHRHKIASATVTEPGPKGETPHRFSFMEALANGQVEGES